MANAWENEVRCPRCQETHVLYWPHRKIPGAVTFGCPAKPQEDAVTLRYFKVAWSEAPASSAEAITATEATAA